MINFDISSLDLLTSNAPRVELATLERNFDDTIVPFIINDD